MNSKGSSNQDEMQAGRGGTPRKTVDDYLGLPYTLELWRAPEGGWVTQVKELPGCVSQGETAEEALEMIQEAMEGWLEVALEYGDAIPEPRPNDDFSGKFVVRVPRSLHRDLVAAADREGASLNQFINVVLAQAVGRASAAVRPDRAAPTDVLDSLVHRLETVARQLESALAALAAQPGTQAGQDAPYKPHQSARLALKEGEASYESEAAEPPPTPDEPSGAKAEADEDTP